MSIAPQPRAPGRPLLWFEPDPEDPAALEAMIAATAELQPPVVRELGRLYARLARARSMRGENADAEAALEAAYGAYVRAGTLDDRVDLLLLRSDLAARIGRKDEASAWLEKARQEVGSGMPSPQAKAKLLFQGATLALERRDFESAATALPPAIEAARAIGDQPREAMLLVGQAWLASHSGRTADEMAFFEHAVELFRSAGRPFSAAIALRRLAAHRCGSWSHRRGRTIRSRCRSARRSERLGGRDC